MAAEKPPNWGLCPTPDVLPKFDDAPKVDPKLAAIRDQQPTDIEGDQLSGTTTVPNYTGNVALKRGDQFMGTDSLRVDTETGNYIAEGHVRYQDSSIRMIADRAEGNQDTDTHKISNIRYQLIERRGNGKADSVDLQGALGQMHRSTYTTCDPSQQVWELHAPEIDVDNDEGFGTARNAILKIYNVPILYAPWFKFPIDDRRSSGFLFPAIGMSSRNGFDYMQPYYLNLAPNYDATLYPRYMSSRGFMLGSEFRYLYEGGKGEIEATYMPSDQLRDKDRGKFEYQGYHNINPQWQARASIAWVSDERYTEDFSNRLLGNAVSNLQSTIGVYGTGETWTAGLMADRWQLTDYTLTEAALPYSRQPRAFFTWDQSFGRWFEAGVYSEAVRFVHDDIHVKGPTFERTGDVIEQPGGSRLDVKPYISMPLAGAAWFLKPTLAWRYTAYQLDKDLAAPLGGDTSPSRSLPITTVDAGLYFDRDAKFGGTNYLQTLEPRLFYLYTPYRDQNDLPIFDTREFTFSWGQLFRDSRYTGADRQNDANQLTMALARACCARTTARRSWPSASARFFTSATPGSACRQRMARPAHPSSKASRPGSPTPITCSTTAGRWAPPTSGIPSTGARTWPVSAPATCCRATASSTSATASAATCWSRPTCRCCIRSIPPGAWSGAITTRWKTASRWKSSPACSGTVAAWPCARWRGATCAIAKATWTPRSRSSSCSRACPRWARTRTAFCAVLFSATTATTCTWSRPAIPRPIRTLTIRT